MVHVVPHEPGHRAGLWHVRGDGRAPLTQEEIARRTRQARSGRPWRTVQFQVYAEETHCWGMGQLEQRDERVDHRLGDAVEIVDVVDTYARMAGEFDRWLFDRIGLKSAPALVPG
jgi:hypothetical protein